MNAKINDGTHTRSGHRVVILGGGYAGLLAAIRLAGKTRGTDTAITLVNGSDTFTERIRLHQMAAGQRLPVVSIPRLLKGMGVRFVRGWATEIDANAQTLEVQQVGQGASSELSLPYDKLIYALGSSIDLESVAGVAQNATALASPAMVKAMRESIPALASRGGRVLVVGGGLTGIEAATELAECYPSLNVTLATNGRLGAELSTKGQAHLRTVFTRLGVEVAENLNVQQVEEKHIVDVNGTKHPYDLCIWSAGFTVPQLAAHADIKSDEKGRVLVDEHFRSISHPNIYAVGDSALTPLRMACATAMPMGCHAADHLAASVHGREEPKPFQFAYAVRCISLGRKDALIQDVNGYDLPKERIFSGRMGVLIKEFICRFTIWALRVERWIPGAYQWPKAELDWGVNREEVNREEVNSGQSTGGVAGLDGVLVSVEKVPAVRV